MKKLLLFALVIASQSFYAQTSVVKKPEYVILVNNEISTMAQVEKYGAEGYVKSMNKGVSEKERDELAKKFGDKIGDREFIFKIELYTEQEKLENDKKAKVQAIQFKKIAEPKNEFILNVEDKAKDFTLKLIDGKEVKLSDLKGKVVLVNFWATWCAPCLMELYDIPAKIITPNKDKDFVFLAISIGEKEAVVQKKVEKLRKDGIDFNFGLDPNSKIWNEYAKGSIPKSFIIDKEGVIKFESMGNTPNNLENMAAEIEKLLAK